MKRYRIRRIEKLIHDLKYPDENELRKLKAYEKFCIAADLYVQSPDKTGFPNRWWNLQRAIAALIENAMEGGDKDE